MIINILVIFVRRTAFFMTKIPYISIVILLLISSFSYSQKKTLFANRITENITIDGKLDEHSWSTAEIASDFIMYSPDNGKPMPPEKQTMVKIIYDNDAIYIAAVMIDDQPDKILKEMTQRDVFGTAEHFGVFINGFNDGQQDFRFFLSAAGVQMDCVTTEANGEDFTWDAIWDGNVSITEDGWIAEMKIPYAALRFSSSEKQSWGINFYRELRRDRQQYTWNHIDNKIGLEITQTGNLQGIENIETPTRLFLIPYSSYYLNVNDKETDHTLKAGLDIKYGISDSFTLDAILVPDFGQTRYDNVELNLGPFEQQFIENRPFFTEGTDLFKKGDLLYSRRIGGAPSYFLSSTGPNYIVTNPESVNLLNAVKVSGRTDSGLGIGILNAITEKTYATFIDLDNNANGKVVVEPLTNFNVLVLDQRFNGNSSVSFVNTNVLRDGFFRDANVSAGVFDLNTKANTYNLSGDIKYSFINEYQDYKNREGINTSLRFAETSGAYRYDVGGKYVSKDFDNNDLGINFQTHYHAAYGNASYRILNANKYFNTFQYDLNLYSEFDNQTGRIQEGTITFTTSLLTLKNNYLSWLLSSRPVESYDFYEPRYEGRFVVIPVNFGTSLLFQTNTNKKISFSVNPSFTVTSEEKREAWSISVQPQFRFNDRFTTNLTFNYTRQNNNAGYIDDTFTDPNLPFEIYFAKRNRSTYNFSAGGKYAINKEMTLTLNARYYWSYADNREFYTLADDGQLIRNYNYNENQNSNFNTWNLDLSYSWWFAPGSQVSVLYRNNSFSYTNDITKDLNSNFSNVFSDNLNHVFSVSVRYFIDYNQVKKWF